MHGVARMRVVRLCVHVRGPVSYTHLDVYKRQLLPMGLLQLQATLEHGYWYARSADFMGKPVFDLLVWMRVPGDTIFSVGAVTVSVFVFRLWWSPWRKRARAA